MKRASSAGRWTSCDLIGFCVEGGNGPHRRSCVTLDPALGAPRFCVIGGWRQRFAPQFFALGFCEPPDFGIVRQDFGGRWTNGNVGRGSGEIEIDKSLHRKFAELALCFQVIIRGAPGKSRRQSHFLRLHQAGDFAVLFPATGCQGGFVNFNQQICGCLRGGTWAGVGRENNVREKTAGLRNWRRSGHRLKNVQHLSCAVLEAEEDEWWRTVNRRR